MRLLKVGLGGALALLVLGAAARAEGLDGAIDTLTGILNEADPTACLPGGGLSLLGVKYADTGMTGWTRLRDDHPARVQQQRATAEVNEQLKSLTPVTKQVEKADRALANLSDEITYAQSRLKENQEALEREQKAPIDPNESELTREQRRQTIATLQKKIEEDNNKSRQMKQTIEQTERDLVPVRRKQAELDQSLKAARVAENAAWVAANAAGNACP